MKSDEMLQNDVLGVLQTEAFTAIPEINVTVCHGTVTLTGKVDNYSKKVQAENVVKNVAGIKDVVNEIDVMKRSWKQNNDIDITSGLLSAFSWNWNTLNNVVKVDVINGWVTLSGELAWNYQRDAAKTAATNLIGVKGVTNLITLKSDGRIEVNKSTLERALKNHMALDVTNITTEVSGCDVILKGSVDTWYQKELAGRIAWKAPGVIKVTNELIVDEGQI
ncbi:MAG: BON domain-containing protein [Flavobacterium sp.]|uniref:BON domain-containing protein n=1 Tax=Flavobacterium sp. TaxID=239 RepID=UPI003267D7D8